MSCCRSGLLRILNFPTRSAYVKKLVLICPSPFLRLPWEVCFAHLLPAAPAPPAISCSLFYLFCYFILHLIIAHVIFFTRFVILSFLCSLPSPGFHPPIPLCGHPSAICSVSSSIQTCSHHPKQSQTRSKRIFPLKQVTANVCVCVFCGIYQTQQPVLIKIVTEVLLGDINSNAFCH